MSDPNTGRAADEAAIKTVLTGIYKAWDAHDADAFVADYTEDATAALPGSRLMSREEVRRSMAEGFASALKGSTTSDKLVSIRFLGRDAAVAISETAILMPGETVQTAARTSNATWVLEKRDGDWLLAAYHNSPTVMAPLSA